MRGLDLVRRRPATPAEQRYNFDDWANDFFSYSFGGNTYGPFPVPQSMSGSSESVPHDFESYVGRAYKSNGVVFACVLARMALFSEARFQWQQLANGVPGDLFGTPALRLLERPAPNKTTREILARIEQDVSLGGNAYLTVYNGQIRRLRPDWVAIIAGSEERGVGGDVNEVNWDVLYYQYHPGGLASKSRPVELLPSQVAHFSPIPDPLAVHRGMSWLTPVVRNVTGHNAATDHKLAFFKNGATPNMVVSFDPAVSVEAFDKFKASMDRGHKGAQNAYKTLYLGGGADVTVVGNSFEQMSFKAVQGQDETIICAAAGVPPIIVGVSEGLQSATYSNYGQARRKFGDHWARPQWGSVAASLETLFPPPSDGVRLWYDDRNIAFLREDRTDEVKIQQTQAMTLKTLIDAGYDPASARDAVVSGDLRRLSHSGLYSVQLQPPGAGQAEPDQPADAPAA